MKMKMKAITTLKTKQALKNSRSFIQEKFSKLGVLLALICLLYAGFSTALNAQDNSKNFTSGLTSDQIEQFGDYTVEEALARIPGIQVDRDGTINQRGVGQNKYYVTVDGQRMGTTGLGNRGADLSAISVEMISEVEFIKVLTPEMEADGLAGVINLKTYQADTDESLISGGISGGLSSEHISRTGPAGRAWIGYSSALSETIKIALRGNYQRRYTAWQSLGMEYGAEDFGSGNVDVVDRISPGFQTAGSDRLAGTLNLDFTPNESTKFWLRTMANVDYQKEEHHSTNWLSNSDWNDQSTTGVQGSFGYDAETVTTDISQYTVSAGGEHLFNAFTLAYKAGWSRSEVYQSEYLFPFETTGVEYEVDLSERNRPLAATLNQAPEPEDLSLQNMVNVINNQIDQKITGNIDVKIPLNIGSVKLGTSALLTDKDANDKGAYSKYTQRFGLWSVSLEDFEKDDYGTLSVFDNRYELGRLVEANKAETFYQSSIPNLRLDERAYHRDTHIYNYFAKEDVYSAYGMATFDFDPLTLIGGIRAEHTMSDYDGRRVDYNRFGGFVEENDTSATNSYTNLFPHAQLSFHLNDKSNITAAYSRSITRQDFNYLSPFELVLPQDTLIYQGNNNLNPITSDNLDLGFDYELTDGGLISVGGFYKNISNLVVVEKQDIQIQPGEYATFDDMFEAGENTMTVERQTFQNMENSASIFGVEVALQHNLTFLPGVLSNLGTYANYTWSQSDYKPERDGGSTAFPGQSPHVVNAALSYHQSQFSAQVSYHWSAEVLSELQDEQELAPSISSGQVYLDRYRDGYQDLSATVQYQLTEQFQMWANVYNLLQNERVEYAHTRDYYPTSIYKKEGIEFNVGIRFNL